MANLIIPINAQIKILSFLEPRDIAQTACLAKNPWLFPTPLPYSRYGYELVTVEKISRWAANGVKIGLFIGRRPNEVLPEKEEILWISMDPETKRVRPWGCPKRGSVSVRYHLQMPFDPAASEALQNLFEKVVVDQSTFKAFRSEGAGGDNQIIENLIRLLNPQGEALLAFNNLDTSRIVDEKMLKKFARFMDLQDSFFGPLRTSAISAEEYFSKGFSEEYAETKRQYWHSSVPTWEAWHERAKTMRFLGDFFRGVRRDSLYPVRPEYAKEFYIARGLH